MVSLQSSLLQNALPCSWRQVIAAATWDRDPSLLLWMLVLPVTSAGPHQPPAVLLDQPDSVVYLGHKGCTPLTAFGFSVLQIRGRPAKFASRLGTHCKLDAQTEPFRGTYSLRSVPGPGRRTSQAIEDVLLHAWRPPDSLVRHILTHAEMPLAGYRAVETCAVPKIRRWALTGFEFNCTLESIVAEQPVLAALRWTVPLPAISNYSGL